MQAPELEMPKFSFMSIIAGILYFISQIITVTCYVCLGLTFLICQLACCAAMCWTFKMISVLSRINTVPYDISFILIISVMIIVLWNFMAQPYSSLPSLQQIPTLKAGDSLASLSMLWMSMGSGYRLPSGQFVCCYS